MSKKQTKNNNWSYKIQSILQNCQEEVVKATNIGKKMIFASKTNSELKDAYESLGILVSSEIANGNLSWDNPEAKKLVKLIDKHKKNLSSIEDEVNDIKFSSNKKDL